MPLTHAPNPNHHLWRNGRLWWIAFTVVYDGWRQERVRRSLGTAEIEEARRRRDDLLHQYAAQPNAEVVALRLQAAPFRVATNAFGLRSSFGLDDTGSARSAEASRV